MVKCYSPGDAPVVQWIGYLPPKEVMQVRFLPGALQKYFLIPNSLLVRNIGRTKAKTPELCSGVFACFVTLSLLPS